jgi:hypothetical protein
LAANDVGRYTHVTCQDICWCQILIGSTNNGSEYKTDKWKECEESSLRSVGALDVTSWWHDGGAQGKRSRGGSVGHKLGRNKVS